MEMVPTFALLQLYSALERAESARSGKGDSLVTDRKRFAVIRP